MTVEEGNTKLSYLNSVEVHIPSFANIDINKPKYFINFPYPYMNGKLHLGHLYSLSKSDFLAYYKKLQGFNTLFPLGFHCTGMPISASAQKIREELAGHQVDVSVVDILKSLGFDDPRPFVDPLHWIRIFPNYCIDSLKKFHSGIDWRRSFITTDINKYYDSFIRYQFKKLKKQDFLCFGKRYSIFCTVDQQACLDHDRRVGEGIKPVEVILRKIVTNQGILLIKVTNNNSVEKKNTVEEKNTIEKIVIYKNRDFKLFEVNNRRFVIEADLYENIKYQVDGIKYVGEMKGSSVTSEEYKIDYIEKDIRSKITTDKNISLNSDSNEYEEIFNRKNEEMVLVESNSFIKIYEPEGVVISRSGSQCVVSLMDQWFIDYSNKEWKIKARKCIDKMILTAETRAKLEEALDWINKWGFSRSFGLGTRIPWDEQYLIDSLSDSTIHFAFHTFKHFLFNDLEGKEEIFPSSLLSDEFWEFIFQDLLEEPVSVGIPVHLAEYKDILESCKLSLEYFYPVDYHGSGKDLIGNHLIFYIFNHVGLFKEKYWPVRIFTNGHLMLNSAKMSKSSGNFLTVEGALEKYGASATRICLAACGDTNEDANFLETTANASVLKLFTLTKAIEDLDVNFDTSLERFSEINLDSLNINEDNKVVDNEDNKAVDNEDKKVVDNEDNKVVDNEDKKNKFVDVAFVQTISKNIRSTLEAYDNLTYRDVLKYGFYENLHLIELYSALGGDDNTLVFYAYKTIMQLLYPIIPSLSTYLIKLKFNGEFSIPRIYTTSEEKIAAIEHLKTICSRINSSKNNNKSVDIIVGLKYSEWKSRCIEIVDNCSNKSEIIERVQNIFDFYKINKKKGMVFCMDYFMNKDSYLVNFDEFEVLDTFNQYINNVTGCTATVVIGENGEPLVPALVFH